MKNLKNLLLLIVTIVSLSSFQNEKLKKFPKKGKALTGRQINFIKNSLTTALSIAKTEDKYIFIDAYAVWCGPCKQLENTTFKDSLAAIFFNRKFVNVSLDMERGEGIIHAAKWAVNEFPTLLILDYNGKIILRSVGYLNAKQLIEFGTQALQK